MVQPDSAEPPAAESLDAMVERARRALAGDAPDLPTQGENEVLFAGSAADGLVTAEVTMTGTVRGVVIDPAMFSRPLEDVSEAARTAVNAALDARPGAVDFSALASELRAVQEQARRDLSAITNGMAQVAQRVGTRDPITGTGPRAGEEEN